MYCVPKSWELYKIVLNRREALFEARSEEVRF